MERGYLVVPGEQFLAIHSERRTLPDISHRIDQQSDLLQGHLLERIIRPFRGWIGRASIG
jgi:hypothetical protein